MPLVLVCSPIPQQQHTTPRDVPDELEVDGVRLSSRRLISQSKSLRPWRNRGCLNSHHNASAPSRPPRVLPAAASVLVGLRTLINPAKMKF